MPKIGSMMLRVNSVIGSRSTGSADFCALAAISGFSVSRYQRPAKYIPASPGAVGRTG